MVSHLKRLRDSEELQKSPISAASTSRGPKFMLRKARIQGDRQAMRTQSLDVAQIAEVHVAQPKDKLKTGTLHAMLKQLGLSREDI